MSKCIKNSVTQFYKVFNPEWNFLKQLNKNTFSNNYTCNSYETHGQK